MYQYNSSHKVITVVIVLLWIVFHFSNRKNDNLQYNNGQIKRTSHYVNSLNEGKWTWYYQDGSIQIEGNFHKGKREGVWYKYTDEELLIQESHYVNNKLNGLLIEYDTTGKVVKKYLFQEDVIINKLIDVNL